MVAVTGAVVVFVAVNTGRFPTPLAAKPIDGVLFVQLYTIVPPVAVLAKVTAVVAVALQSTLLATAVTVAVGFTVMVKMEAVPVQLTPPLVYVGVTVMVSTTGAVPVLMAVKDAMSPVPLAAKPIEVFLFIQLYTIVPPVLGLAKVIAAIVAASQTTLLATAVTVALGFTVMV
jgi:hypothetical protein